MKYFAIALVASALTAACTATAPKTESPWACTAPGMVSGSYDGGSMAYVHLAGYNRGGNYRVTADGTDTVSGKTADGTPFVCRMK